MQAYGLLFQVRVAMQLPSIHTFITSDTLSLRFQAVNWKRSNNRPHSAVWVYDMSAVSSLASPTFTNMLFSMNSRYIGQAACVPGWTRDSK